MDNIIFLHHEDQGNETARRQIRARAAQHSHRIGPRKPKAKGKRGKSRSGTQASNFEEPERPNASRRGSTLSVVSTATSLVSGTDSVASRSATPSPSMSRLGSYADDPFNSYPVPSEPWFGEIIDYMWTFMLRGWLMLPNTTPTTRSEALLWVKRLTMQDPCYFYMNMLSATSDLASQARHDPSHVVYLTAQLVSAINAALSDSQRALATGTILAVGRLALREIIVGDVQAGQTFHRPAFARMLAMKGGVQGLGVPELVRLHLAWGERMMWRKTGVKIGELERALERDLTFAGVDSSDEKRDGRVLDEYLPRRGQMVVPAPAGADAAGSSGGVSGGG